MKDWNVVVSVQTGRFRRACELLEFFGPLAKTDYFNVLVMKVEDPKALLDSLHDWIRAHPEDAESLGRVVPCTDTFSFQSAEEFESRAGETARGYAPRLAGKRFHVRMHRRGFKRRLSSMDEERMLADGLLAELETAGTPGGISFDDPDAIVAVETVGNRAGMSSWTREELARYPLLGLS